MFDNMIQFILCCSHDYLDKISKLTNLASDLMNTAGSGSPFCEPDLPWLEQNLFKITQKI